MRVPLDHIVPSKFRDWTAEPLNEAAVAALKDSIHETGLWPTSLPGRRLADETVELAYGYHLVEAAKLANETDIDVDLRDDLTDLEMAKLQTAENFARRTDTKQMVDEVMRTWTMLLLEDALSDKPTLLTATVAAQVKGQGLGAELVRNTIEEAVGKQAGLNSTSAREAMARMKTSGVYLTLCEAAQAARDANTEKRTAAKRVRERVKLNTSARRDYERRQDKPAKRLGGRPPVDAEVQKARRTWLAKVAELDAATDAYLLRNTHLDADMVAAVQPIIDKVRAATTGRSKTSREVFVTEHAVLS